MNSIDADKARISYLSGSGRLSICMKVPHGSGLRTVELTIKPEKLIELARVLDCAAADRGHAFWHYENPDATFPCESCSEVVKQKVKPSLNDAEKAMLGNYVPGQYWNWNNGRSPLIETIKAYRARANVGLKEAKDVVEAYLEARGK